jgi:Na+-driven multidrug efflux pump
VGLFGSITFERLLQSTGRTFYPMITQTLGAVINLIMDPILIFGLLGFPKMGVAGAAVATVMGQICSMLLAFRFCRTRNPEVPLHFRGFRPNRKIIREIYAVGVPSIIMQSISSVMTYGVNRILIVFSTTATAVFGVYFKLQSFVFMPVFGLNSGLVPIIAFNYGARDRGRISRAFRVGLAYAIGIMAVGLLVFQVLPTQLLQMFDASRGMLAIGVPALRIVSICFLPAAFSLICSSTFQALGSGVMSMLVSIARQLLVLLPAAWVLSLSGKLDLVWWAFPIADLVAVLLSALFLRRIFRLKITPLGENPLPTDIRQPESLYNHE